MINKVILIGNLGQDPEVRTMQNGGKVCNLSVATSERWTDKSGEKREKTEWHRVVIFDDRLVEIAEKYLSKGSKVYLEGQLQTRKWTDKDNNERYSTEIVLNRFRSQLVMLGGAQEQPQHIASRDDLPDSDANSRMELDDLGDDIPF